MCVLNSNVTNQNLSIPPWLWVKEKNRRNTLVDVEIATKREHYRSFFKRASARKAKRVVLPEDNICEKLEIDTYE